MLRRNLYYTLKPFIPAWARLAFRRAVARRARRRSEGRWPVDTDAVGRPADWPGWPDGKPFSFVLTHDVEGPAGLARCRELAELELSLGFRSSFNFIPEGGYAVPDDLRHWLVSHGFEVGVHDLHHDGKLYRSRAGFAQKAARINEHLRRWGAVGYRSGFMHHNLEWQHDLEILYDASTFDGDPFEPQPDGVGTIFPFFVPRPRNEERKDQESGIRDQGSEVRDQGSKLTPAFRNLTHGSWPLTPESCLPTPESCPLNSAPPKAAGYVELPYTLVQDSTLFLLLQEKTPGIWQKKLEWIVRHGGMALLNVHPDYIRFGIGRERGARYPVSYYADFLRHVRAVYGSAFWQPLPRELALWYRESVARGQTRESTRLKAGQPQPAPEPAATARAFEGRRAAVIVYSDLRTDPRPWRAAVALRAAGMQVDVFCRDEEGKPARDAWFDGLSITTMSLAHDRGGMVRYLWQYLAFFTRAALYLTVRQPRRRYDLVHVHNMPDFLVFAALVPRLCGARVLLDLHDPMPEVYEAIHDLGKKHIVLRALRTLERWSIAFAHLAITPNEAFVRAFQSRGCPREKLLVVMNTPDESVFSRQQPRWFAPADDATGRSARILFHGSIVHRHGLDLAVDALEIVRQTHANARLVICGWRTPYLDETLRYAESKNLRAAIDYLGAETQSNIARIVADSDVILIPNRRSPFTEINMPTRIFEAIALDRPVVVPSLEGIRDYFPENALHFFNPDDAVSMARAIREVLDDPKASLETAERARAVYASHLWTDERARFLERTATLLQTDRAL